MSSVTVFFFLGVISLIGFIQAEEDYCNTPLCKPNEKHIACGNTGEFTENCPLDKKIIDINEDIKNLILKLHNTLRNDLAGGKVDGYKGATRMASMQWDEGLAKNAVLHVKDCTFDHDECHSTTTFKHSGQNLAQTWYSGINPTYEETADELIKSWWDEKKDANMDVINKFPKNWDGEDIGHFTAMAQQANTHCGCAAVWMIEPEDGMDTVLLTCNYATTNMINEPVYETGAPASKCKTGTHKTYTNLCSPDEKY